MIEHDCVPDTALPPDDPAAAPEPTCEPAPAQPQEESLPFSFSGSGAEYFRIWIVNLLLTVATLGIYSAWAKTRRLQYFYRNTHLAGASFDFRGDPKAILRGRILAVLLVAAYQYAFGFSARAGVITVAVLVAAMPFLIRSALRFRLSNTWYRGLPFGFAGSITGAYRVYLLPMCMFILPGVLAAMAEKAPMLGFAGLLYLCWPLMHGAMKRYQHANLVYGDQRASFELTSADLAAPYLAAVLAGFVAIVAYGIAMYVEFSQRGPKSGDIAAGVLVIAGTVLLYLVFLVCGLFITVRMNNMAWSDTAFPGVRIASAMRLRTWLRLQAVNVVLTILTLGLFRPFAAVRSWRYRLDHARVEAPAGFESATGVAHQRSVTAAGDGSAEFLGFDLSW
jgi:uncharacterized membrane protein YjgN (DUF898 family)